KLVTFTPVPDSKPDSLEWTRVTFEDGVRIVGMKEIGPVSFLYSCPDHGVERISGGYSRPTRVDAKAD
ncbi:hypothetical protein DFH29DRAFT_814583, partial [Suillus ampliporus]